MRKIVRLAVIRSQRRAEEARVIRASMFRCARNAMESRGEDLSGFVLVTWGRAGDFRTAINTGYGPYSWAALPEHCRSALQQHISLNMQDGITATMPTDDEGA